MKMIEYLRLRQLFEMCPTRLKEVQVSGLRKRFKKLIAFKHSELGSFKYEQNLVFPQVWFPLSKENYSTDEELFQLRFPQYELESVEAEEIEELKYEVAKYGNEFWLNAGLVIFFGSQNTQFNVIVGSHRIVYYEEDDIVLLDSERFKSSAPIDDEEIQIYLRLIDLVLEQYETMQSLGVDGYYEMLDDKVDLNYRTAYLTRNELKKYDVEKHETAIVAADQELFNDISNNIASPPVKPGSLTPSRYLEAVHCILQAVNTDNFKLANKTPEEAYVDKFGDASILAIDNTSTSLEEWYISGFQRRYLEIVFAGSKSNGLWLFIDTNEKGELYMRLSMGESSFMYELSIKVAIALYKEAFSFHFPEAPVMNKRLQGEGLIVFRSVDSEFTPLKNIPLPSTHESAVLDSVCNDLTISEAIAKGLPLKFYGLNEKS